jgi:nucleotide-binding universal stress UspA family protein
MPLLAAVDSDRERPNRPLVVANDLARDLNEELVVLHVLPKETAERRIDNRAEYYLDDAQEDATVIAREVIEETLGDDADVRAKGRVGAPAEEILDATAREHVRYLVIGGRRRTPVGKALFGSVTQSILLESETPVISVMEEPADPVE